MPLANLTVDYLEILNDKSSRFIELDMRKTMYVLGIVRVVIGV